MKEPQYVWLLTSGVRSWDEHWHVEGIYDSEEKALAAKRKYEEPRPCHRPEDGTYTLEANDIEKWELNKMKDQSPNG